MTADQEAKLASLLIAWVVKVYKQKPMIAAVIFTKLWTEVLVVGFPLLKQTIYLLPVEKQFSDLDFLNYTVTPDLLKEIMLDACLSVTCREEILIQYWSNPNFQVSDTMREHVMETLRIKSPLVQFTLRQATTAWWKHKVDLTSTPLDRLKILPPLVGTENIKRMLIQIHTLLTATRFSDPDVYEHNNSALADQQNPIYLAYRTLKEDLPQLLEGDMFLVTELAHDGLFSTTLINTLLSKLEPRIPKLLESAAQTVSQIQTSLQNGLQRLLNNLMLPRTPLMEIEYLLAAKSGLERLLNTFGGMQLKSLKIDPFRLRMLVLEQPVWEKLPLFYNFGPTQAEIMEVVRRCHSLESLKSELERYAEDTTNKLASFADPSRLSEADWQQYVGLAHVPSAADVCRHTLVSLGVEPVDRVLCNARRFAAIRWTLKNASFVADFVVGSQRVRELSIVAGPRFEILQLLAARLGGVQPQDFKLSMAMEIDPQCVILDDADYQQGTGLLAVLAQAPKTLQFLLEQTTEDITAMRDDCDHEDNDLAMKLEFFNLKIRPILEFATNGSTLTTDFLIKSLAHLSYPDQLHLIQTTPEIESRITHLKYIFEKAQKSINFTKKQVEMINRQSVLSISYSTQIEDFEVSAKLISDESESNASAEIITPLELKELFNKIRILILDTSRQASARGGALINSNNQFENFLLLNGELVRLIASLHKMRELGALGDGFHQTLLRMLTNTAADRKTGRHVYFKLEPDERTLQIRYSTTILPIIQEKNAMLESKCTELASALVKAYTEGFSFLCYFQGGTLFRLIALCFGEITDVFIKNLTINLVYEAFRVSEIQQIAALGDEPASFATDFVSRFRLVVRILTDKTEKVIRDPESYKVGSKDSLLSLTERTVKVLLLKNGSCEGSSGQASEYEWILRLLYYKGVKPHEFLNSCQVLLCGSRTNRYELLAFLTRALLDPLEREYFILDLELLPLQTIRTFKQDVDKLHQTHKSRFNRKLMVFIEHEKVFEDLKHDTNAFELLPQAISDKIAEEPLQMLAARNPLSCRAKLTRLVISESAGMGKSLYIKKKSKDARVVGLFLAGELSATIISSRLHECMLELHNPGPAVLVIKLEYTDRLDELVSLIDFTLFKICFLGRISSDYGCLIPEQHLVAVYIEVGKSVHTYMHRHSKIFRLLHTLESPETPLVVRIPSFSADQVRYRADPQTQQQRSLNLVKLVTSGKSKMALLRTQPSIEEQEYRSLVQTHFVLKSQHPNLLSFSQFVIWSKTLAYFGWWLDDCKPILATCNPRLRLEVAEEMIILSNLMSNMSEGVASEEGDNRIKAGQWNMGRTIIPLMTNRSLVLLTKHAHELSESPDDPERHMKRDETRSYLKLMDWYFETVENGQVVPKQLQYEKMLAHYLSIPPEEFSQRCLKFRTKGYAITLDNLMKMGMMILKANIGLPIVLIGESGCGKSYLTEFLATCLLQEEMRTLTIHSGVTIVELLEFVAKCITTATNLQSEKKRLWVFFDEFNTSALQSIIAEILLDRVCPVGGKEIRQIPPNIVFIAACNPLRLRTQQNVVGLSSKTSVGKYSHVVLPVTERLLTFAWDFGQLPDEEEKSYAKHIISNANLFADLSDAGNAKKYSIELGEVAYKCHKELKHTDEFGSISLRDLNRVIKTYAWFRSMYQEIHNLKIDNITDQTNRIQSTICSLMLCYGLRLNGQPEKLQSFGTKLCKWIKEYLHKISPLKAGDILRALPTFVDKYLFSELQGLADIHRIIPEDVATNRPLKENFIAMLVGFDTLLPVIICGSPGTSKTLCSQVLARALHPEVVRHPQAKLFRRFKPMFSIYYGGSQTSTAEGVKLVFERGRKYLANTQSTDTPTVLFDEIGLAELSPHNPLKVLHPLLENQDRKGHEIAFIGLSNWSLDLSKMNRLIYVARADLASDDLMAIFENSISKLENTPEKESLRQVLQVLALSYFDFRSWQTSDSTRLEHRQFHGSRDIYSVAKFIYRHVTHSSGVTSDAIPGLIKQAIERNFSGEFYPFGFGWTDTKSIPGLDSEPYMSPLDRVKFSDLKSIDSIRDLCNGKSTKDQPVTYLTSAGVFKRFFWARLRSENAFAMTRQEFFSETDTMRMIDQNLLDKHCRFLMLKSEGELIDTAMVEKLRWVVDKNPLLACYRTGSQSSDAPGRGSAKIVDWRGLENREDPLELLSTLKTYISEGYIVIMKNLDGLYGSLYDLFNQKYTVVKDKKSCFLYYGESKQKVNVHDNFKCIVIIPASPTMGSAKEDIELKQPAPFLNRFEKFYVRIPSLISETNVRRLLDVYLHSASLVRNPRKSIFGFGPELIASICITMESITSSGSKQEVSLDKEGRETIPNAHLQKVLQMSTSHILLDLQRSDISKILLRAHPHKNLCELVDAKRKELFPQMDLINRGHSKSSPCEPWEVLEFEKLQDRGVQSREQYLSSIHGNFIMLIPGVSVENFELLNQLKSIITNNREVSAMIVVVQLDRDIQTLEKFSTLGCVDFWNNWDNIVMDDLEYNDYEAMHEILNKTLVDIVRGGTNPFLDGECANPLVSRVCRRLVAKALLSVADGWNDEAVLSCKQYLVRFLEEQPLVCNLIRPVLADLLLRYSPTDTDLTKSCKELLLEYSDSRGSRSSKIWCIESLFEKVLEHATLKLLVVIVKDLETYLGSLWSYAKGCCSSDPNFRELFRNSLQDRLRNWQYSENRRMTKKLVHMELPFLREDPEFVALANSLKRCLADENLKELVLKLRNEDRSLQEGTSLDPEKSAQNITEGQRYILTTYFAKFDSIQENLEEFFESKCLQLNTHKPKCIIALLFDVLRKAINQPLGYLGSLSQFEPMVGFLCNLFANESKPHNLKNLLFVYVYVHHSASAEISLLAGVADKKGKTTAEILQLLTQEVQDCSNRVYEVTPLPLLNGCLLTQIASKIHLGYVAEMNPQNIMTTLRMSLHSNSGNYSTDLATLLLLELLKSLKFEDETTLELQKLVNLQKEVGDQVYLHQVKAKLHELVQKIHLGFNMDKRDTVLELFWEYGYMCGMALDLQHFMSDAQSKLFSVLETHEKEKLCRAVISGLFKAENGLLLELITSHEKSGVRRFEYTK